MTLESGLLRLPLAARYAVTAVMFLASAADSGYRMLGDIAAATGLPASYLAKILQRLARAGVLESRPGAKGGYCLAAHPRAVTLSAVVDAACERGTGPMSCVLEARECGTRRTCAMHRIVKRTEALLRKTLSATSLAAFSRMRAAPPARVRKEPR